MPLLDEKFSKVKLKSLDQFYIFRPYKEKLLSLKDSVPYPFYYNEASKVNLLLEPIKYIIKPSKLTFQYLEEIFENSLNRSLSKPFFGNRQISHKQLDDAKQRLINDSNWNNPLTITQMELFYNLAIASVYHGYNFAIYSKYPSNERALNYIQATNSSSATFLSLPILKICYALGYYCGSQVSFISDKDLNRPENNISRLLINYSYLVDEGILVRELFEEESPFKYFKGSEVFSNYIRTIKFSEDLSIFSDSYSLGIDANILFYNINKYNSNNTTQSYNEAKNDYRPQFVNIFNIERLTSEYLKSNIVYFMSLIQILGFSTDVKLTDDFLMSNPSQIARTGYFWMNTSPMTLINLLNGKQLFRKLENNEVTDNTIDKNKPQGVLLIGDDNPPSQPIDLAKVQKDDQGANEINDKGTNANIASVEPEPEAEPVSEDSDPPGPEHTVIERPDDPG